MDIKNTETHQILSITYKLQAQLLNHNYHLPYIQPIIIQFKKQQIMHITQHLNANISPQPYNTQHLFFLTPKKQQISKIIKPTDKSASISTNTCSRCITKLQHNNLFRCIDCNNNIYCQKCDIQIHKFNKFNQHRRIHTNTNIQQTKQISNLHKIQINYNNYNYCSMIQQYQQNKIKLQNINIQQNWNNIIYQISQKFMYIIDMLKDKHIEILDKIYKKKQQQIATYYQNIKKNVNTRVNYNNSIVNMNINMSNNNNNQAINKKIRKLSNQYIQNNTSNIKNILSSPCKQPKISINFKTILNPFQQLATTINKIQFKNIITKISQSANQVNISHYLPTIKKTLKNALISSSSGQLILNPCTKVQKQYTLQVDYHNKINKIIEQTQKKNKQKNYQQILLNKVKSEKIITNLIRFDKQKTTSKKGIKLEQ